MELILHHQLWTCLLFSRGLIQDPLPMPLRFHPKEAATGVTLKRLELHVSICKVDHKMGLLQLEREVLPVTNLLQKIQMPKSKKLVRIYHCSFSVPLLRMIAYRNWHPVGNTSHQVAVILWKKDHLHHLHLLCKSCFLQIL